jgi:hypothetical protein
MPCRLENFTSGAEARAFLWPIGTAEEVAEKVVEGLAARLKSGPPKTCLNHTFSAASEAVPFPGSCSFRSTARTGRPGLRGHCKGGEEMMNSQKFRASVAAEENGND